MNAARCADNSFETPGPSKGSPGADAVNARVATNVASVENRTFAIMRDASATAQRESRLEALHSRVLTTAPTMAITVQMLHDDAQPPRRATEGSAGYDLHAYVRGRIIKCSDGQRTW